MDQLYQMADRPPIQTSSPVTENNIDHTLQATHVYVKRANPLSLQCKFEGPYETVDRPSRSQVTVKIGCHVSGEARTLTFHWSSCKIAHMREGALEASRPKLGRPPKRPPTSKVSHQLSPDPPLDVDDAKQKQKPVEPVIPVEPPPSESSTNERGKIQTVYRRPVRSTRNPAPHYT